MLTGCSDGSACKQYERTWVKVMPGTVKFNFRLQ